MTVDLRKPNITGRTEAEKFAQLQSYLYQFVDQLQWALNNIESGDVATVENGKVVKVTGSTNTTQKLDPVETFNTVKSLIAKSSDIVNAYYEQMNKRFEGEYVAQSEYGTFTEKTSQDITANANNIQQVYADIQQILSTVAGIEDIVITANAYIKSGLLYYVEDGSPRYGLEIGQTNTVDGVDTFDKFARFTSDRLSFYDRNDVEVAYISDYKLYITNAQITGSLILGRYELDTSDGIAFVWIGG